MCEPLLKHRSLCYFVHMLSAKKWCDCFGVELHITVANMKLNIHNESKPCRSNGEKQTKINYTIKFCPLESMNWSAFVELRKKTDSSRKFEKPFDFQTCLYIVLMDEGISCDFLLNRVFQRRRRRWTATAVASRITAIVQTENETSSLGKNALLIFS